MYDTMSILAPLPIETQCDVIKKIKRFRLKDPVIIVFREDWKFRLKITAIGHYRAKTLYVDYKKIYIDRRSEK